MTNRGISRGERDASRFFILCFLLHDQSIPIEPLVRRLDDELDRIGLSNLCFHAGPIIRHEDGCQYMNWQLRSRLFSMMMAFSRRAGFRYRCICIDKKFVSSTDQMLAQLKDGVSSFIDAAVAEYPDTGIFKVYYDCGQAPITNLLRETLTPRLGAGCEFVQGVKPIKYKLFQAADLICTISLVAKKLDLGISLTKSETKFFGGVRKFRRNILKPIQSKAL